MEMVLLRCNRKILVVMMLVALLCLLIFWPMILVRNDSEDGASERRLQLVENTASAMERLIDHLFQVGDGINLDGVFCIRFFQAQLAAFLRNVGHPYKFNSQINSRVTDLIDRLDKLQDVADQFRLEFTKHVERNNPTNYKNLHFLLTAGDWELWYSQRNIDHRLMPTYAYAMTGNDTMVGEGSDRCMMEPYFNQCQSSEACWNRMAYKYYKGYSLTHEVLFLLNGIVLGCGRETEMAAQKWKQMTVDELLQQECAAVLHEVELIEKRGYPSHRKDLFMEQAALCGILGFRDFFREEWLEQILSWQDESGCYSLNYTAALAELKKDFPDAQIPSRRSKRDNMATPTVTDRQLGASFENNTHHRQKRVEQFMSDGCWAHMTGVAAMALGQYIRFFLEPILQDNTLNYDV